MEDLAKQAIMIMEAKYLPRILTMEVALLTAIHIVEDHIETLKDKEVKAAQIKHLGLLVKALNDKEYLSNVFDEDMKHKLSITKHPLEGSEVEEN